MNKAKLWRSGINFTISILLILCSGSNVGAQNGTLPFSMSVTKMPLDSLPDYLTAKSPDEWMDFPVSTAMIDGAFWVIFKNGETKPAFRYKGTNFENARRQPDGTIYTPVSRPYILGGMWYDSANRKLYAPLHCETRGYYTTILRQIHLASSTDMGLTWKYEGPIITRDDPALPLPAGSESSGLYWDGGEGDFIIYVDKREGYIYLYTNSYTWSKPGVKAPYFFRHHVARCKISDKMAPGKWQKFYNGTWSEPGLGGKASEVNGYYVMYNTYLGKYISFNYGNSISMCSDLSKQDWTPCFNIKNDYWGGEKSFAWLVTDAGKTDTYTGGKTLFVYSYWEKAFHGLFKIDFEKGETPATEGYMVGYADGPQTSVDTAHLYLYGSRYESSDNIESRHANKINSSNPEVIYKGDWADEKNDRYFGKTATKSATPGNTIQFSFKAKDIYWRAVMAPDGGKADVYLDGVFQKTIDCRARPITPLQFAFSKQGLDPAISHTIRIVVRNSEVPDSSSRYIRHLSFEYTAESYRASDGYSSTAGKNNWYYEQKTGKIYTNMVFKSPDWSGTGGSAISYFEMTSGGSEAVRKWVAPKQGTVQLQGNISIEKDSTAGIITEIRKNNKKCWTSASVGFKHPAFYDVSVHVKKGDAIYFILKKKNKAHIEKAVWDPIVTYE